MTESDMLSEAQALAASGKTVGIIVTRNDWIRGMRGRVPASGDATSCRYQSGGKIFFLPNATAYEKSRGIHCTWYQQLGESNWWIREEGTPDFDRIDRNNRCSPTSPNPT